MKNIPLLICIVALWFLAASQASADLAVSPEMVSKCESFIDANNGDSYSNDACLSMLTDNWTPSFNTPWHGAAYGQTAKGKTLPPNFVKAIRQMDREPSLLASLMKEPELGVKPVVSNKAEANAFAAIGAVCTVAINSNVPDAIPQLFSAKGNQLPPTNGDYVILRFMNIVWRDRDFVDKMPGLVLQAWIGLAQAKNPAYRAIAAIAFRKISDNILDKVAFYNAFAQETDPDIAILAIGIVADSKFRANAVVLRNIEAGQRKAGNSDAAKLAGDKAALLEKDGI